VKVKRIKIVIPIYISINSDYCYVGTLTVLKKTVWVNSIIFSVIRATYGINILYSVQLHVDKIVRIKMLSKFDTFLFDTVAIDRSTKQ
jgi:hypothetical protein